MKQLELFCEREIHSPRSLLEIYLSLQKHFRPRTLILLMGPVGAGKTTSVQMLAEIIGCGDVSSPSFAIHHRYESSKGQSLDHVDLYRLESEDDLESTGFWDLFSQSSGLIVVEWAERLDFELLPLNWFEIRIFLDLANNSEGVSRRQVRIEMQK